MASGNTKGLTESLHHLERNVLMYLTDKTSMRDIVEKSRMKDVEVMRALQWLENKKIVEMSSSIKNFIELDDNGKDYIKKGLPERRFLKAVSSPNGLSFDSIREKGGLSRDEFNVCIGVLRKKAAILVENNRAKLTEQGNKFLAKKSLEEVFLEKAAKEKIDVDSLMPEEKFALTNLKKRKGLIKEVPIKTISITLTEIGRKVKQKSSMDEGEFIDRLTPEMLKTSSWKKKRFRKYDIKINVPEIYGGRRHFVNQAIDYIKRVWLDMGFKEMEGQMLDTSFWNFDALFTAQDHPARELQDTFYIKNPAKGKLPEKNIVNGVKSMHENGGKIGSSGWGYKWDPQEAMKNVLRPHTTVLSARTIAKLKHSELPAKFFSVARCFRNEALDWKHLFELTQVEGIVIDPDANFRNLIGYLKEFFKKLGYERVRVRPAYFPYTEPSAEVEVFHPIKKEWVELGGSGIFRPEVVVPLLGKDVPVLAWGMGLERSIMDNFNIKDIRNIYGNDLKMLREIKIWRV